MTVTKVSVQDQQGSESAYSDPKTIRPNVCRFGAVVDMFLPPAYSSVVSNGHVIQVIDQFPDCIDKLVN